MKNIVLIIAVSLFALACEKQNLVKDLAGNNYVMRMEQPDNNVFLNDYIFDSTFYQFKSGGVVYRAWVNKPLFSGDPRSYGSDTTYYTTNKKEFTIGGLTDFKVKSIQGDNFTADITLTGGTGDTYTAYFFLIK